MAGFFDLFEPQPIVSAPPSVPPRLMDDPSKAVLVRRMKRGGFSDDEIERVLLEEEARRSPEASEAEPAPRMPGGMLRSEAATRPRGTPAADFSSPWAEQYGGTGGVEDFVRALTKLGPYLPTGAPAEPRLPGGMMRSEVATRPPVPPGGDVSIPDLLDPGSLVDLNRRGSRGAAPIPVASPWTTPWPEPGAPAAPVLPGAKPSGLDVVAAAFNNPPAPPGAGPAFETGPAIMGPMASGPAAMPGATMDPVAGVLAPQGAPGAAPAAGSNFFDKLFDADQRSPLIDIGLRLMAAAQPKPGTTVGPSTFGAIGEAGLETLKDAERRKAGKGAAALEREKLDLRREEIQSTRELRKLTVELKAQSDQLANEIRLQGTQMEKGRLAATLAEGERKALDDLRGDVNYMVANPEEQKRNEQEIRNRYDKMRQEFGIGGAPEPGASAASPSGTARPTTRAEFDALPSGAEFYDPKGVLRRKP